MHAQKCVNFIIFLSVIYNIVLTCICFTLPEGAASAEYLDPMLIANELQRNPSAKEIYGLPTSSLFWKLLAGIKDNNTFSLLDRTADGSQHGVREFRNLAKENEKSRSTIRINRNNDFRRKHPRNIRPRYSQIR